MQKFKVAVSKGDNKYSIIIEGDSKDELKERLHKEGYLVLSIENFFGTDIKGEKFLFVAEKDGEVKKGAIIGEDIFKVYLKIRHGLGYNVSEFYSEKDSELPKYEKDKILKQLEEQYLIFKPQLSSSQSNIVENQGTKVIGKKEEGTGSFFMKKELEDNYKIIDIVLGKLKNILDGNLLELSPEERDKYNILYNNIIKIKKITNITKIRELGEYALLKIGNLELELLEKSKDKNHKTLLQETNNLLGQIGSKNRVIPKNEDIKFIIKDFYDTYIKSLFDFAAPKVKEKTLDKESYTYLKTLILLDKYKSRLKENTNSMLSKFYIFLYPVGKNKETISYLLLKNKVIKQNIALLKSRISGKKIKYTKVANSFTINDGLVYILNNLSNIVINITFLYSLVFLVVINVSYYFDYNIYGLNFVGYKYLLMFLLLYIVLKFSKGIKSFIFNVVIFYFINIFFGVNF